jgi:TRAP-type C4-dicarboxylate transport system permease small subunit
MWLQFALIALFAVAVLYGGWVVFKPSIEAGDVFFPGQSKYMLQLYVAYVIAVCAVVSIAAIVVWKQHKDS